MDNIEVMETVMTRKEWEERYTKYISRKLHRQIRKALVYRYTGIVLFLCAIISLRMSGRLLDFTDLLLLIGLLALIGIKLDCA